MLQVIVTLFGTDATPVLDQQVEQFARQVDCDLSELAWQIQVRGLTGSADLICVIQDTEGPSRRFLAFTPSSTLPFAERVRN